MSLTGVLVIGYAPFLHAYNLAYYGAVLGCRGAGTLWLSWSFTLEVPLVGFALLDAGTALSEASDTGRPPGATKVAFSLAERLTGTVSLLAAAILVAGLRAVMASEVYAHDFGEGVFFATPTLRDLASPALLGSLGLVTILFGHRSGPSEPTVEDPPAAPAEVRALRSSRSTRWALRLALLACWLLPIAAVPSMGWDVHFDVPPRFLRILEAVLAVLLSAAILEDRRTLLAPRGRGALTSLLLTFVLADVERVLASANASPLFWGRTTLFRFYERHLFTVGRYVNGTVQVGWSLLVGVLAVRVFHRVLARSWPVGRDLEGAVRSPDPVARRWRERGLHLFLMVSILWFTFSVTGMGFVLLRDAVSVHCPGTRTAEGAWYAARQIAPMILAVATTIVALAAAHLMTSTALRVRAKVLGQGLRRLDSDRRAWLALSGAALALCATVLVRLAWLALGAR